MALSDYETLLSISTTFSLALLSSQSVRAFVGELCFQIWEVNTPIESIYSDCKARILDEQTIDTMKSSIDEITLRLVLEAKGEAEQRLEKIRYKRDNLIDYCLVDMRPALSWVFYSGLLLLWLSALELRLSGTIICAGSFSWFSSTFLLWYWYKVCIRKVVVSIRECQPWWKIIIPWLSASLFLSLYLDHDEKIFLIPFGLYVFFGYLNFVVLIYLIQGKVRSLQDEIAEDKSFIDVHLKWIDGIRKKALLKDNKEQKGGLYKDLK